MRHFVASFFLSFSVASAAPAVTLPSLELSKSSGEKLSLRALPSEQWRLDRIVGGKRESKLSPKASEKFGAVFAGLRSLVREKTRSQKTRRLQDCPAVSVEVRLRAWEQRDLHLCLDNPGDIAWLRHVESRWGLLFRKP